MDRNVNHSTFYIHSTFYTSDAIPVTEDDEPKKKLLLVIPNHAMQCNAFPTSKLFEQYVSNLGLIRFFKGWGADRPRVASDAGDGCIYNMDQGESQNGAVRC